MFVLCRAAATRPDGGSSFPRLRRSRWKIRPLAKVCSLISVPKQCWDVTIPTKTTLTFLPVVDDLWARLSTLEKRVEALEKTSGAAAPTLPSRILSPVFNQSATTDFYLPCHHEHVVCFIGHTSPGEKEDPMWICFRLTGSHSCKLFLRISLKPKNI